MNRISESLQVLLWSYVFVYVVACSLQITQVDLWWQLSEGFHILSTFSLPSQPVAAYGLPASPYFDEYAGYEVILALLYKAAGFLGLWAFFISIYLAIIFLPGLSFKRNNSTYDIFSILALLLAGLLLKSRLEQRPELVAGLLQVFLMMLLRRWKLETVAIPLLIPLFFIFVVWTNTHSTFLIGLFTLCLWIGCEMVLKFKAISVRLLLKNAFMIGGVAMLAVMLNPYGPRRFVFPFLQAFDPGATALSPEMWPITNFQTMEGMSVLAAVVLLAWAILTSKENALWLVLFSIFSLYMTVKSYRCVNLLAIALLFIYAARDTQIKLGNLSSGLLVRLKGVVLGFLCLFMLFGDAYSFLFTFNEMSRDRHFITHTSRFAPEVVDTDVVGSDKRVPVLCGYGEGSYLSFPGNKSYRPLLDSGLSHFSDDSKRYFFFVWHEPEAFKIALGFLDINDVIINKDTFHWILGIRDCPGWRLTACTEHGMLWRRIGEGVYVPSESDRVALTESRDRLLKNGNVIGAFCYSTLLDKPNESLAIIAGYSGPEWTDSVFNYFNAWLDTLPPTTLREFLSTDDAKLNVPLAAILWARLDSEKYDQFVRAAPPGPRPWFWKIVQVRNEIARGDMQQARETFKTISTTQPSSVSYYNLWRELSGKTSHAEKNELNAYGEWQTWDEDAGKFIQSMSVQLNDRMAYLSGSDAK